MKNILQSLWNKALPNQNKKIQRPFLIALFLLLPIMILWIVLFGNPFNYHPLKFGEIQEFQGVYFSQPKPMLIVDPAYLPEEVAPEALLIGNNELSAESILDKIKNKMGAINGKRVRLRGRTASGDGKMIIELTELENTFLYVESDLTYPNRQTSPKPVVLGGEILDPKCWFAALKPAKGNIHKGCTTTAIRAGTPPLLKVDYNGRNVYYIIETNKEEGSITSLIEFIAQPVQISGKVFYQNGWNVLQTSIDQIRYLE